MTPAPHPPPPRLAVIVAFTLIYVCWGTTYIFIQWGVRDEGLPPALFGGSRVFLGGLVILAYQALRGERLRLQRNEILGAIGVSWLLFVGGNGLINLAEKWVDSGVAAILVATTPLWIGLFAMFWPHDDRLTLRGWLGLIVGLGGVAILWLPRLASGPDASSKPFDIFVVVGPLCVLGSACCWALGSLLLRHLRTKTSHLTAAGFQMVIGGGSLSLLGIALGELSHLPAQFSWRAVGIFTYLLLVGSLIGFVAFNWLLGHVSAAKVGTYAYVNPMIAVVIAWIAGEAITGWTLAGIATILMGVFLVRTGERPPTPTEDPTTTGPAPTADAPPVQFASEPGKEIC